VRENDHRGAACGGRQNTHRRAKIAIRQIVAAKNELKGLLLDSRTRIGQGTASNRPQPDAAGNFFGLLKL
jgi:hypothetical protein